MSLTIIAAIADNNVIGKENALMWKIPRDLRHFKEVTMGHPIIMGRKTFASIGRLLPGRQTIILTRDPNFSYEGADVYTSPQDILDRYAASEEEVFVIGGAQIYEAFLPYAHKLIITHVHAQFDGDTFFPSFNKDEWDITHNETISEGDDTPYPLSITAYTR
ncbi:MAG: hypothetical protein RIQ41_78 [Candidatus Parcubacteria bacterium]|jgi:dihydrofolate reductase